MTEHPLGQGTPEPAPESSAQLVSKVARYAQERHETTQREAQRARPNFILDIEQSEIVYTLRPQLLPLAYADPEQFAGIMREKWGLALDLKSIKLDPASLHELREEADTLEGDLEAAIIRKGFKDRDGSLMFKGGRYRLSSTDFVPINLVKLNFESVLVSVAGIGRVAEAVAQEVVELVSATAGAQRSWDMLETGVKLVGYATKTRVNLGSEAAFENFLSPDLRSFLDAEMVQGERFAAHTGSYHARDQLGPPPDSTLTFAVDDLVLFAANFDTRTGMSKQGEIRFSVTGRGDYRSGEVSVSSEFPYDVHERFIGNLIKATKKQGSVIP